MKYTFLLPAYKGRFLDEMLRSIQGQTYTDFKVVISDDNSPEDLRSICEPYLSDPRFTYRRNEENMGGKSLVAHWNLLVDMCDTEFLILASDDDVYEPQFLEEIDKLTMKYPQVDIFKARASITDEKGEVIHIDLRYHEYEDNHQFLRSHFTDGSVKCIANLVLRTQKLKAIKGFHNTPLAWYSDQITSIEMSDNGCANTADILFYFRKSNYNISGAPVNTQVANKKAIATLYADKWFSQYLKTHHIEDFEYKRWGRMIYYWLTDSDFKTVLKLTPQLYRQGLWDGNWLSAIYRHHIKTGFSK